VAVLLQQQEQLMEEGAKMTRLKRELRTYLFALVSTFDFTEEKLFEVLGVGNVFRMSLSEDTTPPLMHIYFIKAKHVRARNDAGPC